MKERGLCLGGGGECTLRVYIITTVISGNDEGFC